MAETVTTQGEFVVSARKYRPQTFRSVIGQKHITETLIGAIARGQLAHAYLFTGPRGVGKTTCARIFARSINCLTPTADHEACGACESCVAFAKDRSFNIHEMDAASNNSVEDIRSLNEKVRVKPQIGRYSVYIIDEVHMLSTAAFNAFLKTLEEPPAHAIFILATTEKHKILPTILSRCQCYDFNRIRAEDTVDYLKYICKTEGITSDDESLHIIAQKADGGMRDALSTFDMVVSFCGTTLTYDRVAQSVGALDFDTFFSATDMALQSDYASLIVLFDSVLRSGFEGQHFIAGLADHFRALLVAKNPKTATLLEASGSLLERYTAQAVRAEIPFLFAGINLLGATDSSFRSATNRRLHAELALMKLCGLKGSPTERAVLPKIEINGALPPAAVPTTQPQPNVIEKPAIQPQSDIKERDTPQLTPVNTNTPNVRQSEAKLQQTESVKADSIQRPSAVGGSILGLSINSGIKRTEIDTNSENNSGGKEQITERKSPQEIEIVLTQGIDRIIDVWKSRNRLRIATALSSHRIDNSTITLIINGDTLHDELMAAKLDIERDILEILGIRVSIEVEMVEEVTVSKPVTIEQKLQYLVDKNPELLNLRDRLDLTI